MRETRAPRRSRRRSGAGRPGRAFECLGARVFAVALAGLGLGCGGGGAEPQAAVVPRAPRGRVVDYAFGGIDGSVVSSQSMRGRVTVLLFVTTFDLASQGQAKRLEEIFRRYRPRINAAAIVLEPPKYAPLARSFKDVLGLSYDVALADTATRMGQGPLGDVRAVPTWVVFDRDSRPVFARAGVVDAADLKRALEDAGR